MVEHEYKMTRTEIICNMILLTAFFIAGITGSFSIYPTTEPLTKTYLIPNSYFTFTGSDISEAVESCLGLGDDYCTSAQETPDGMQLELTEEQLDNQIQHNDNFIEGLKKAFESSNSQYQCVLDESYQKLTLYCDENLSSDTQAKTILGIVSSYGMNYMLTNDTTDWNVKIEIFNCHTGKLVASANLPDEEITYGTKEWQKSYN